MKINQAAAALGKKGGKAGTGKAKARTSEQARAAAKRRWAMKDEIVALRAQVELDDSVKKLMLREHFSQYDKTRELLNDAAMALSDLGACNDPKCAEPNCLHILSRIRSFLE